MPQHSFLEVDTLPVKSSDVVHTNFGDERNHAFQLDHGQSSGRSYHSVRIEKQKLSWLGHIYVRYEMLRFPKVRLSILMEDKEDTRNSDNQNLAAL